MAKFKLKDLSLNNLEYGSGSASVQYDGHTRYIRITDIDDEGHLNDDVVSPKEISEKYILKDGDILFARTGATVGKTYRYSKNDGKCIYAGYLIRLVPNSDIVYPDYIWYFTKSPKYTEFVRNSMKVVAQPNINANQYGNLEIEVPLKSTQEIIIKRLDGIRKIIDERRCQLRILDTLIKARFVEMFGDLRSNPKGWPVYRFEEITDVITDGEHATPRRIDQGIYLLSARNVLDHSLQLSDVDFIDQDEYDRIAKRIVPKAGDVLISCSGSVGRCCTVPEGLKFQMVRSVALLRFDKRVVPVYAEYMITSDDLQDQINSSKTASSQANLFQGKIAKLKGFLPPVELQKQFVTFVSQVDKSKAVVQAALDKAQVLFDSLMQEYFG